MDVPLFVLLHNSSFCSIKKKKLVILQYKYYILTSLPGVVFSFLGLLPVLVVFLLPVFTGRC